MLEAGCYLSACNWALAPAQEVSSPCPSIDPSAKINKSNNIQTPYLSLFSLNLPPEFLRSTKLVRTLPATVAPPADPRQQTRTRAAASWSSSVRKFPPTAASSAACSLAAPRCTDCCSTGCGYPFQVPSKVDSHARQLKCVRKKQFSSDTIQSIKSSPDTCVGSLETLGSIDCSASPAVAGKSGVEVLTTAQPVLQLSRYLSTLVLGGHKRLSNRETSCDNPQLSKIPTKVPKPDPQAVRPDKSSVSSYSTFFGYSELSSRPSTPEIGVKAHHEKVTPLTNSNPPNTAAVASAPPGGGGDKGSKCSRPQRSCLGNLVLINSLCPERPDIAADAVIGLWADGEGDDMDIDKEFGEEAMDKEEGGTNGSQERESGSSSAANGTESNGRSEQSNGAGSQSGPPASAGGGSQNGSSGGSGGNDGEKKPPTDKMDLDRVEVRVKKEPKEEKERKSEMSQDEKDRLNKIAILAQRTQNGEAMDYLPSDAAANGLIALHHSSPGTKQTHIVKPDSPNRHHNHTPPHPPLSNGARHSPNPVPLQPGSQPDITISNLPIIPEPVQHQAPGPCTKPTLPSGPCTKPTLPSLSSALSIHQLADAALHPQAYSNTPQPGHFSPPQTVASIACSQRSSDTPQPIPISPPTPSQAQAGYGPEGAHARKPIHHMTVQEQASYVHAPALPAPAYYTPMQYQYTHMNEEMHAGGPPPGIQGPSYAPPSQHVYAPSRELPGLAYTPAAPYHYSHEAPSAEPQPLRRGSAANIFTQPPFEEHTPTGPPTGETMISVAESDDTIVAPQMATPKRASTSSRSDGTVITGTFRCGHPGCTAPPFQTQYLLNSHANVHSANRPHFCQVPGCPRGEKGRGFKRKNEMIRHGLVHESPGYVCPFCPDREHKYPRPDNLQRHVRVHHQDRSRDDPQLREVLAQRPEGGSRGRRRRVGG